MTDVTLPPRLKRALNLPLLVFYGVGVTVGAGIFALIGEVLGLAGDKSLYAFLVAGLVAGMTGFSYVLLAGAYPRAAGEAVFVLHGLGRIPARIVGYAVVVTAVTSSAVISLAFARHVTSLVGMNENASLVAVIVVLALIAMMGVKESVIFASIVTLLEVSTLLVVAIAGAPLLADGTALQRILSPPLDSASWSGVMAGGFLAFFAFIGFEDIENMAEEAHDARRTIPLAIILTLVISVSLYGVIAVIASAFPDRAMLVASKAPMADLFAGLTGYSASPVATMASVAMVNGILVQIIMASRVLYGMADERLVPRVLGRVHATRQTPVIAIAAVAAIVLLLALFVPLVQLAETTSLVMLMVFATVNASLVLIGSRVDAPARLRTWRLWGVPGAAIALCLAALQCLG